MSRTLRGSAAVVGVGLAGLGEVAGGRTAIDIMAEAAHAALAEAGLTVRDVDGLFPCSSFHMLPGVAVAEGVWWIAHAPGGRNVNALTSQRLTDRGNGSTFYDNRIDVRAR